MHQSSMLMMMRTPHLLPPFAAGVGRRRLVMMMLLIFSFTILIRTASGFVMSPPSAMQTQTIALTASYPPRHRNNDDDMLSTRTAKTVLQVSSSTTPPPSPNQNDNNSKNPFSIWNKILDSGQSEELSSTRRRKRILSLDLNMMERQIYQRQEPPISTLSWFPLKLLDNTTTTTSIFQEALNERIHLILQHNPWLQGRIVAGSKKGSMNLVWEEEESSSPKKNKPMMVQVAPPDHSQQLSKFQTSPVSIDDIDVKNLVKIYTTLPPSDQGPLWKIALLLPTTSTETNSVGVILTVSHFVADAHTYYQLYHMLTGRIPVKALDMSNIPNNNVDSDQLAVDKLFGTQAWDFVHGPVSLLKGILGLVELHVHEKLFGDGSRTGTEYWYQVDQNVMEELKTKLIKEDPDRSIISTNDILSSWFLSRTDCAFGLMCCNYRNKLEGHGDSLGRNYWGCYALNEFTTPHQVRHQMTQSVEAKDAEVYPTMKELLQKPLGIVSSWTGTDPISIHDQSGFLFGPPTSFWPLFDFATYCPLNFCVMRTWTMPDGKTGVYLAGDSKWLNRLFENDNVPTFLDPYGKESSP